MTMVKSFIIIINKRCGMTEIVLWKISASITRTLVVKISYILWVRVRDVMGDRSGTVCDRWWDGAWWQLHLRRGGRRQMPLWQLEPAGATASPRAGARRVAVCGSIWREQRNSLSRPPHPSFLILVSNRRVAGADNTIVSKKELLRGGKTDSDALHNGTDFYQMESAVASNLLDKMGLADNSFDNGQAS